MVFFGVKFHQGMFTTHKAIHIFGESLIKKKLRFIDADIVKLVI